MTLGINDALIGENAKEATDAKEVTEEYCCIDTMWCVFKAYAFFY